MRKFAFGTVASALLFTALPAAAQPRPLEMRCQGFEAAGTASISYAGTFRANGIRATKVISSSAISIPPAKTTPATAVRTGPGAPAFTLVYEDNGTIAFARFTTAFAARQPIRASKARLVRGKTILAEFPLAADKAKSIADGETLWLELPDTAKAKVDGSFALIIVEGAREALRFDFNFNKKALEAQRADFFTVAETNFLRRPMVDGKIPEKLLGVSETGCRKM